MTGHPHRHRPDDTNPRRRTGRIARPGLSCAARSRSVALDDSPPPPFHETRMNRLNLKTRTLPAGLLLPIVLLAVTGCGGGGGGETNAADTATDPTPPVATTPTPGAVTGDIVAATPDTTADITPDPSTGPTAAATPTTPLGSAAATSTLVVRASGVLLGGVGSMLKIIAGGQTIATTEVRSTAYQDYVYTVPTVSAGTRVDIAYTNDGSSGKVDRNAFVESITVDGKTLAATAAQYDVGSGNAAFDGVDVRPGQSGMFWNGALRFVVDSASAPASTSGGFYVDATAGNDANAGNSESAPWKTLAKLAGIRLSTGQGIFLRCGQTWREPLVLSESQLVNGSTVAGYGSECTSTKAVVSGAVALSGGWTRSGNVWSRSVAAGTPKITRLTVGSTVYRTAQWPNYAGAATEYDLADATSPSTRSALVISAAGAAAVGSNDLVGATVALRSLPWQAETATVAAYSGGRVTFSASTTNTLGAGVGYLLQDKPWMLDAGGEFFHDTTNNRVSVVGADADQQANLNGYAVEGAARSTVVKISGRTGIVVRDLEATMSAADGFAVTDVPGVVMDRVRATRNGRSGIALAIFDPAITSTARSTISAAYVDANWVNGIDATHQDRTDVLDTSVKDTGMAGNVGNSLAGIAIGASGSVQRSTVASSAQSAIRFSGTGGSVVRSNSVQTYCLRFADCGAIYSWNGPKASRKTTNQSWTVEKNQVLDGRTNANGALGSPDHVVAAVYLDDYSQGGTIRDNTIATVPIGIFLHNVSQTAVSDNRVWLTTRSGLTASMDQTDYDYMTGNTVSGNEFVRTTTSSGSFPAQPVTTQTQFVQVNNSLVGTATLTSGANIFSANRYLEHNGNTGNFARLKDASGERLISAEAWLALASTDAPAQMPVIFAMSTFEFGPNLLSGGDFSASLSPWTTYFTASSPRGSARWLASLTGCSSGCVELKPAKLGDMLSSPAVALTAGTLYQYRYTAVYEAAGTVGEPFIARTVSPWDSMMDASGYKANASRSGSTGQVTNYEAFFTAKTTANAQVNIQVATAYTPIAFDNVSLRAVLGYRFSQAADWRRLISAGTTALTVDCAALGWPAGCSVGGPDGTPVALPATVNAGDSRLFVRLDSEWKR
ncbi:hypothetical protein CKO43_06775 [Rubrivivax gelatinosus]|uniref:Carbohydrate binding module xylan-binding domain-containing protein n=2 Tax=Rubrivivax gelatinosus TaxID=28068 RepID=A0ABS1DRC1_RUBGE|nr:hypothetical protein [Rubrivivax gelatinosus]